MSLSKKYDIIRYLEVILLCICVNLCDMKACAQNQKYRGYPLQKWDDLAANFKSPPPGYGNVPFYWWNGDSLDLNRLKEQLDILSTSATDGLVVSYIHMDPMVDLKEHKKGYGLFGKTASGNPPIFSEQWWNVWRNFTIACAEKGIGLGMDDYTIGWKGNGFYPDEVDTIPTFKTYQGNIDIRKIDVKKGDELNCDLPHNLLSVVAWPGNLNLEKYIVSNKLSWKAPVDNDYTVYVIHTLDGYLLHPLYGKKMVELYFDRFEKEVGSVFLKGNNYFFQDELYYPLTMGTWAEDFKEEFEKRKGYNIIPYLPAIKYDIGDITPKVRLDYCDVLVDLAEERYFKPIYDWIQERGLIYGCDNMGRGKDPLAYVDYFRTNAWYTAPGNDAPAKGSNFISTKISSSIAHLNNRPRTWLEAFHSMGWDSSTSWLRKQIDHHFIAGGNLLCLHGLYYSTHGGWWEWAPPCFHFRMPYWEHTKIWLNYAERLSFLMSQGKHVCDIAIVYPTETLQVYTDETPESTFKLAMNLSNVGLDYDFINYTAIENADVQDGKLKIGHEQYKMVILSDIKAMHHEALLKILEFYRSGGSVIACGALLESTSLAGRNSMEVNKLVEELFGSRNGSFTYFPEMSELQKRNGIYTNVNDVVGVVYSLLEPDFKSGRGEGKVLHRQIGDKDVYMVTDVVQGDTCYFRKAGKVQIWDALTGKIEDYPVVKQTEKGTWLTLDKEKGNSYLIVFSPGVPVMKEKEEEKRLKYSITLDSIWNVELLPTMNNHWGDFRWPAFNGFVGAEARSFRNAPDDKMNEDWINPSFDDSLWTEDIYGYGLQTFEYSFSGDKLIEECLLEIAENKAFFSPYSFSWQYGVWDNPGSQGMHGLKAKIDNRFFILNKKGHQVFRTQVYANNDGEYEIVLQGVNPDIILIDNVKTASNKVFLKQGWHSLLVVYANTIERKYKFERGALHDFRNRSAIVLSPISLDGIKIDSIECSSLSMTWNKVPHLLMDPYGGIYKRWNYRVATVPGLKSIEMSILGDNLRLWFNGKPILPNYIILLSSLDTGEKKYKIEFEQAQPEIGLLAFSFDRCTGYQGAAALTEPIKFNTETGILSLGDWSKKGALKYYSGGMYYRKDVNISCNDISKAYLDLGDVVATAEVKINGYDAGVLLNSPYQLDITNFLKEGNNQIEILVYSTLSNHYQTIPTPYRGNPKAGLLGPVRIYFFQ